MIWLYFSFVDAEGFLGGMYVPQASDDVFEDPIWEALLPPDLKATKVAVRLVPESRVPEDHKYHNRLLSKAELDEATEGNMATYRELRETKLRGVN